eukprot:TRINITY_DN7420_c0_g1_i1.p1 TRINITY_DN7420_c0_g1~~TRINITY_DN7420_c0_g1_i1.p1  ORF type:complete len:536 (-),score=56.52 TRINITY_DN7420_c0_g1_i1:324-1931(-)
MALTAARLAKLSDLTTGARDDYFGRVSIVGNDDIVQEMADRRVMRLSSVESRCRERSADECIQAMQTGFPVSVWCKDSSSFVPRFLKTDDRLMFLLLIKPEENDALPQYWFLSRLGEVWTGKFAKYVCMHCSVQSQEMGAKSVVVLHCKKDRFQNCPPLEDTLIFLAASHARLGKHLRSIKHRAHPDNILHDKHTAISHQRVEPGAKPMPAEDAPTKVSFVLLAGVRLKDPTAMLRYNATCLDFEIEIVRPEHAASVDNAPKRGKSTLPPQTSANSKEPFLHSVKLPLLGNVSTEVDKFMRKHSVNFRQIDRARLELCFRDMGMVQSWAHKLAADFAFGVGVHRYLQDEDALHAMLAAECRDVVRLVDIQFTQSGRNGSVFEAGAKSASKTLKNLMELELKFADLVIEGYKSGVVEAMPLRFTLSGELLPPLVIEKAAKEPLTHTTPYSSATTSTLGNSSTRGLGQTSSSPMSEPPLTQLLKVPLEPVSYRAPPRRVQCNEDCDDGMLLCTARSSHHQGFSGLPCFTPRVRSVQV